MIGMGVAKCSPYSIEIDNYGYENAFFQSLYIKVKKNNELISQKKIIDNIFNCHTSFFSPHISLYYGHKRNSIKKNYLYELEWQHMNVQNVEWVLMQLVQNAMHN